jgi:hypothetical protein
MNDDSKFTLFPKLALELRRKIWTMAAEQPEARSIKISTRSVLVPLSDGESGEGWCMEIKGGPWKVPSLLHTSREARETVTKVNKVYILSFENELHGKPIYFNLAKDILDFESLDAVLVFYGFPQPWHWIQGLENHLPKNRNQFETGLRHLAIRGDCLGETYVIVVSRFQKLEEVTLGYHAYFGDTEERRREEMTNWLKDGWQCDAKERVLVLETYPNVEYVQEHTIFDNMTDEDIREHCTYPISI